MSAARVALALASTFALASCGPRSRSAVLAPPRAASGPVAAASVPRPVLPRWRAIPVPPDDAEHGFWVETGRGRIVVDESGVRWFFHHRGDREPTHVVDVDQEPFVHRGYSSALGLLFFTPDDRVLATKTPLGAAEQIAVLPKDAEPESFRAFRGGFTVRAGRQMLASRDGRSFRPVNPLADHVFLELLLGADGRGLGLFAPGVVARTRDDGASWERVPTDDLTVEELDEEQGRALLRPGSPRDGFARSVDLDSGKTDRDPSPPRLAPFRLHPLMRRSRAPGLELPLRPALYGGWHPGRQLLMTTGDQIALLDGGRLVRGQLGEALRRVPESATEPCSPQQVAVCRDRLVVDCAGYTQLTRADAPPVRVGAMVGAVLGFDRQGALIAASALPEGGAVVRTYDPERPEAFTERIVPTMVAEGLSLTGGCDRPALWLSDAHSALRLDRPPGEAPHVLPAEVSESTAEPPDRADLVGVQADGELVLGTSQGLLFVPSGRTFSLGPARGVQVSFAEDGKHGLWRQSVGALLQTADGGRSWTPLPSPFGRDLPVVCGATRCLFGEGAFLDGFVEDPSYVPTFKPAPAVRVGQPAKLRCRPEPLPVPLEREHGGLLALSPRLGPELFAGIVGDEAEAPGSARWAVFGGLDRRISRRELPRLATRAQAEAGSFSQRGATAGVVALGRIDGDDERRDRWTYWTSATSAAGQTEHSLQTASWLAADEVAEPRYPGKLLVWGKSAPAALAFRLPERRPCPGVFVREAAGTLLAGEICDGSLALFARGLDDVQIDHDLVVRSDSAREDGVGLAAGGAEGRGVYLLESLADGSPEIRFHSLSESLALGPGVPVPGTRGKPDALVDLPSCPATPSGTLMRLVTRDPVSVSTGRTDLDPSGFLQRIVRITPAGGCVERTFVSERANLDASLVMAGNGGFAVEASAAMGLRCEPVDVRAE